MKNYLNWLAAVVSYSYWFILAGQDQALPVGELETWACFAIAGFCDSDVRPARTEAPLDAWVSLHGICDKTPPCLSRSRRF